MTQLQSVQPPSSQPQGAGQCFISPVMLSHLTLPTCYMESGRSGRETQG